MLDIDHVVVRCMYEIRAINRLKQKFYRKRACLMTPTHFTFIIRILTFNQLFVIKRFNLYLIHLIQSGFKSSDNPRDIETWSVFNIDHD